MKDVIAFRSPTDVMSRQQVRDFDAWAISEAGIPGSVLMENAGRACAEFILARQPQRVVIVCGTGNNGGDGFVMTRHLRNVGIDTTAVVWGDPQKIKGDARLNYDILRNTRLGSSLEVLGTEVAKDLERLKAIIGDASVVVDALFGTGLTGPLRDPYPAVIDTRNAAPAPSSAAATASGLLYRAAR